MLDHTTWIVVTYVVARSAGGRPTLQHRVGEASHETLCGRDVTGWSRAYTLEKIPQIYCQRCAAKEPR